MEQFQEKVNELFAKHETLLSRKNIPLEDGNGIFTRYQHPVLTAAHTPIFWRYDLTYIIHSGFISGYQNRYGDNLKPPTNVYHRMTA